MHEVEGAELGFRYVYRLFDVAGMGESPPSFGEILRAAELCGFAGLNVTYPYKKEAVSHLDDLADEARSVGAVNTIVLKDGRRVGHNTDLWGFSESFQREMAGVGRRTVLLLGAGGAGGAVAHGLLDNGVETLLVADTDTTRARVLVQELTERFGADRACIELDVAAAASVADGVVNATPIGMASCPGTPLSVDLLADRMWVADIIYFPMETELIRAARAKGCQTMVGSGMAVFQAVRAFELFTGLRPDSDRMKATFDACNR